MTVPGCTYPTEAAATPAPTAASATSPAPIAPRDRARWTITGATLTTAWTLAATYGLRTVAHTWGRLVTSRHLFRHLPGNGYATWPINPWDPRFTAAVIVLAAAGAWIGYWSAGDADRRLALTPPVIWLTVASFGAGIAAAAAGIILVAAGAALVASIAVGIVLIGGIISLLLWR